MKVEAWLADCGQVFDGTHLNPTYLLALYIEAKVIEPVEAGALSSEDLVHTGG